MISFPNCKLNLGLHITEKRTDGFHNIESVFLPIALYDVLEFVESDELCFHLHGMKVPGHDTDNIVLKAYHLIKSIFPHLPPLQIHLLKNIPTGAGLGGGSADGSFMLSMLNHAYSLGLEKKQLIEMALKLGSDCPFFVENKPCFAYGRGEHLQPFDLALNEYSIYLVKPELHVNTGWAFSKIKPQIPVMSCKQIVENYPIDEWKNYLKNDFEEPIFALYPELNFIKNRLYDYGASYASMSGSGSTLYGIFHLREMNEDKLTELNNHFSTHFCKLVTPKIT
jgi:4-diphosphocytidyl-2-C-methyl-D-erythritol kinase